MLHTKTVEPHTLELLKSLMLLPQLQSFLLVGGTALTLQLSHRKSVDLDLFSNEEFDENELLIALQKNYSVEFSNKGIRTLNLKINDVKVDLLGYKYPLIGEIIVEQNIRMMSRKDICAMKLAAISGRGAKKDFYDLYYLLKEFTLTEMVAFYKNKFSIKDVFHVIKSIDYFIDAEEDAPIFCFDKNLKWKDVKAEINKQVKNYLLNY